MEKSEPTLVPEWLKSSGSLSGGGNTAHQFASSSLHSDDQGLLKSGRNRSLGNSSDNDLGRSSVSDRTTSSYFRRTSSSNGSAHLRSYSSFGRSHRDKDWDRDIYDFRDKDKSVLGDHRNRDYSDPLGNILPSRFEKDGLRRSHSSISGKRGDSWPRKIAADSSNASKSNHSNGNALLTVGGSGVHKAAFERDFPSLGAEERHADPEIGRVPSPGLTAIQSLPIGNASVIGGDGWTSALAEVPVIVASNGTSATPVQQQAVHASSVSVASSATTGRNMAETLAQGPPRVQAAPQLSVGTQRLEELAVKQSRQLIPVTPSLPKALTLNPSDKPKLKVGQQHQNSHLVNHSPRGGSAKSEVSKTSSLGKLHVLKPSRERNGISPTAKDSLSPTSNSSKLPNSPLAVAPSVVGSAPLRNPSNNPVLAGVERKPPVAILEKRSTVQAQSRNDFFNSMRKKSMTNSSAAIPDSGSSVLTCVLDKPSEIGTVVPVSHGRDETPVDGSGGDHRFRNKDDLTCNGEACDGLEQCLNNGKNHPRYSEEEEAAFLRSLGWEENAGEDEGLTEEEINAFYRDISKYANSKPSSKIFQGAQPKFSNAS